jgi:hypothetical protein
MRVKVWFRHLKCNFDTRKCKKNNPGGALTSHLYTLMSFKSTLMSVKNKFLIV